MDGTIAAEDEIRIQNPYNNPNDPAHHARFSSVNLSAPIQQLAPGKSEAALVRSSQRDKRNQSVIASGNNIIQTVPNSRSGSYSHQRHHNAPVNNIFSTAEPTPVGRRGGMPSNPNAANGGVGVTYSNVVL